MNLGQMKTIAKSLVRDQQFIDAHFIRYVNMAYREIARNFDIPRLHSGRQVALIANPGSTQEFLLPYDHTRVISFFDASGRSLDIIKNEDVRQYGEYNSLGSFTQFYEYMSVNVTPLAESGTTPILIGIPNRSVTVTASASIFTSAMVGEWLLPLNRNSSSTAGNPEDFGYLIAAYTSPTVVTLTRPFKGVISDTGAISDLTTSYFEVRPRNQPIIRVWGDPGPSTTYQVFVEYQRNPSAMRNPEDVPEEERLSEVLMYKAIQLGGWAYRESFNVKTAQDQIAGGLKGLISAKDADMVKNVHNYIIGNPMGRSNSMIAGNRMGSKTVYRGHGVRY